jgi:mono/diheme cytochrome c family protein
MKTFVVSVVALGAVAVAISVASASKPDSRPQQDQLVARGQYIVEGLGKCADCHTPMSPKGEPDMTQWLMGSELIFQPTVPIPNWSSVAPAIAGLPGWEDEEAATLLMTGKKPDGTYLNPPMPQFRMNDADAHAVVAYLKSLVR